VERVVREQMKARGSSPRDAARVAERVRASQLGLSTDDVSRLEKAALKRARKAGHVIPQGHGGVPLVATLVAGEEETPTPGICAPVFFSDETEDAERETDPGAAEP
jgi:hypothetical protein